MRLHDFYSTHTAAQRGGRGAESDTITEENKYDNQWKEMKHVVDFYSEKEFRVPQRWAKNKMMKDTQALFTQRLRIISRAVVRQFSANGDSQRAKHLHCPAV